ncbi:MAG: EamA family transporter [Coriobacteriaceae bacterium]|jgi:transporter family protein|nr:EamA family transporter [Atopobiaceae bacterium]MCI1345336.1 EamA family transporter [Atopobiaceae bacterium]MCI1499026.1 EamA family transporter [Atopobiaceae bacterium]MCI1540689.1 EamA family transporter [Atopobiaceae bacterium]RRF93588.1 MAG: EamA family transporter [Coriobacteriaceae bacterium]
MWILAACASALFAGITSILAKCGIRHTDSDVATAVRTVVVLLFAWLMAALVGSISTIGSISAHSMLFLALSGMATGASWICYFKALSMGDVNKVVPIDKCSAVLTILLAIVLFGETDALAVKLIGSAGILIGTFLMIERKKQDHAVEGNSWIWYAVGSAVFAALTSILAKVGIEGVESNLATAIRTCYVLVMAWVVVALKGKLGKVRHIEKGELGFICASGLATGASWLCYYYAIQTGIVSIVVPIDKLSIVVAMAFSAAVFHETYTKRSLAGLALIVASTIAMAVIR